MIANLFSMCLGVLVGTVVGIIPAIGLTVSMVLLFPLLQFLEVEQILIFYISLAAMVQYTGSIPSVFFGIPGETNSIPAAVEGPKLTRHGMSRLAISSCALGSVNGSIIGMFLTLGVLVFVLPYIVLFFNNDVKFFVFLFVILFCLFVYNKKNIKMNLLLMALGFLFTLPGESSISTNYRFTGGIESLKYGFPLFPLLAGVLVTPALIRSYNSKLSVNTIKSSEKIGILKSIEYFKRCIPSNIRGSIIGYFCGLVPGISTVLSTNVSYTVEKKINPLYPGRQLVSSETANNSGQLASLLPLLLLGVPITGSEVILYGILTDRGWNIPTITDVNFVFDIFKNLTPWFVLVNICGLVISWPLAKYLAKRIFLNYNLIIKIILGILVLINLYVGWSLNQFWLYQISLLFFLTVGYLLKRYNTVPLIFLFIIGSELEQVIYRKLLLLQI
jgi:putative tricarboxylic transport membrane protein